MATLTMNWYGRGIEAVHTGDVDWATDTIKVALLAATYTPNQGTHRYLSEVNANEVSGTGYTAGGVTLTAKSVTYDSTGIHVTFDAADVSWDPSTITARYAVVYKDTGVASTSPLVGYGDAGTDQSSVDAAFSITWHADGIFRTTAS